MSPYLAVLMNKLGAVLRCPTADKREIYMHAISTLFRRTTVALGAIAAMTVIGPATAQTMSITLQGATTNTCTYSTMSVTPSGGLTVNCNNSTSPGTFSLTIPTSLAISSTSTSGQVRVTRGGGSAGAAEVGYTLSGTNGCTSAASSVSFNDAEAGFKTITITTGDAPGTCAVHLETPTVGAISGTNPRTIQVVDPNADVTFDFADVNPVSASVGAGAVAVTVNRGGGTANAWTVPVSLSPSVGSLSTPSINFPAGSSSAQFNYLPPSTTPSSPALPATLTLTLGTPTGGASGQAASILDGTHTLQLNGPAVGCPLPETNATSIANAYRAGTTLRMPSGQIQTFILPTPHDGKATASFRMSSGTSTFPVYPYQVEVHINKCKGLVQATTGDTCYGIFKTKTGTWFKNWYTKTISTDPLYDTVAEIRARGGCYAPPAEGPWYVNIKYTYAGCQAEGGGNCGWNYQWWD